jgi:hypothetical protein
MGFLEMTHGINYGLSYQKLNGHLIMSRSLKGKNLEVIELPFSQEVG